MVQDYVGSLGSHHGFRVLLALVDSCEYSLSGGVVIADSAFLEDTVDELLDLGA